MGSWPCDCVLSFLWNNDKVVLVERYQGFVSICVFNTFMTHSLKSHHVPFWSNQYTNPFWIFLWSFGTSRVFLLTFCNHPPLKSLFHLWKILCLWVSWILVSNQQILDLHVVSRKFTHLFSHMYWQYDHHHRARVLQQYATKNQSILNAATIDAIIQSHSIHD